MWSRHTVLRVYLWGPFLDSNELVTNSKIKMIKIGKCFSLIKWTCQVPLLCIVSLSRRQLSGEFFPRAMDQKGSLKEPRSELSQGGSIGLRGNSLRPKPLPSWTHLFCLERLPASITVYWDHWVYPSAAAAPPGMNNLLPDCLPPSLYHELVGLILAQAYTFKSLFSVGKN